MKAPDIPQGREGIVDPVAIDDDPETDGKAGQSRSRSEYEIPALLIVITDAQLKHSAQGEFSADCERTESFGECRHRLVELPKSQIEQQGYAFRGY